MPDPTDPVDPVAPPPPPPPTAAEATDASARPTSTGLPSNVAAALACFPLIGGIIFYILEKRDGFVRFYAMQSIIFGAAWFLFWFVSSIFFWILSQVPAIGGLLAAFWGFLAVLIYVGFLIVLIIAIVKAFSGVRWDIPWVGPMARKQTEPTAP
ncbi:MAG: DUF4870 domain-containing protein [Chthoniobacterales bacterium]|nr:DUF4870 domain-containing protein [Chthoniobacterales bacterium]